MSEERQVVETNLLVQAGGQEPWENNTVWPQEQATFGKAQKGEKVEVPWTSTSAICLQRASDRPQLQQADVPKLLVAVQRAGVQWSKNTKEQGLQTEGNIFY